MESGFFTSRDGTSLYYESYGQGKPLLFCYGLVCSIKHWRHQLQYFSKFYRVVTLDYRGHQRSSFPQNDSHLTLQWCVNDVQDLIRFLDLKELVCIGHSMGVPIALLTASLESKRVKGAITVCGSLSNPFEHMFHTHHMNEVYKLVDRLYLYAPGLVSEFWKHFTRVSPVSFWITSRLGFNSNYANKEDVTNYIEGVHKTPFSLFHSLIKDYTELDAKKILESLFLPTLIIAGEKDHITPLSLLEEWASYLPTSKLEKIPEGSHNAHTEFPVLVNEKIHDFLRGISYS